MEVGKYIIASAGDNNSASIFMVESEIKGVDHVSKSNNKTISGIGDNWAASDGSDGSDMGNLLPG